MDKKDTFFSSIANTKPYFKAAIEGFAGSGKTYTAAQIAVGLHKRIKSKKPIVIFDTERAAKFLKDVFADAEIEVFVKESRSLSDLRETMVRMREGMSDILIIDSISHVWENFLAAYAEKVKRTSLQFQDWGIIKPSWKREFSDPFVNDTYHVIMSGRAGYEYGTEKNQDTGRREIFKSGIKMKVEGETAYEPDLLILMERFEEVLGDNKKVWREATIIKDRSTVIDGKTFRNPVYKDFAPCVDKMLANPSKEKIADEVSATGLFKTEEDKRQYILERTKLVEEVEGLLVSMAPGQSAAEKKFKVDIIEEVFGTRSWTAVGQLGIDALKEGLKILQEKAEQMRSDEETMAEFSKEKVPAMAKVK